MDRYERKSAEGSYTTGTPFRFGFSNGHEWTSSIAARGSGLVVRSHARSGGRDRDRLLGNYLFNGYGRTNPRRSDGLASRYHAQYPQIGGEKHGDRVDLEREVESGVNQAKPQREPKASGEGEIHPHARSSEPIGKG